MFDLKLSYVFPAMMTLCMLSSSLASDCLRMGVSLGFSHHKTKSRNLSLPKMKPLDKFSKSAPSAGVFLGYDHLISETPLFIGLEAAINNHNSEKTRHGLYWPPGHYELKIKTNNSLTGSLRLGVLSKNVLIYAKTGIASTNWQTTIKAPIGDKQTNFKKVGYLVGGGLECKMNRNFSFGIEHQFIKSNNLGNIHPQINIKMSPTLQITSLRLIYTL
jgi:opacity protein-like surface antigen